ncbi:MAG: alpha/beta hydrolase [Oceanicaulis sp.]|uniref:alpha/beta fold hydrolase n=1 Tax=Glycocaulis sp. TaxID=1969725 RepID=UPI0025BE52FD|nr:alpha/beta hydrolase [Glycocaulis sp.]MCC5980671.1 alpha/beta hydrolase [Oceanicaulis sp.]MCH8521898.1 alpha/beta hydrolase [Glycocaulis sp.]
MGISRRTVLTGAAGVLLAGGGWLAGSFSGTLKAQKQRISHASQLANTRSGTLEYAIGGSGAPLLMIHGTGGGFDQGLRFGQALMARGFQIIAPSRFGYLRSDFPADPSPARQADALADLLDHLGIERLPVAGGSAGALPAAQFALRHPDRCSALILLVPAMNLETRDPVEFTGLQHFLVNRLLTSDIWFWLLSRAMPEQLIGTLLATDPQLLRTVSHEERERARLILNEIMPVSQRTRGMMNDGHYAGSPADIDLPAITAPTLVISVEDDRFGTAGTARTIASRVAGSRLVIYPTGGHIWLGHDGDIADEISAFTDVSAQLSGATGT